MPHYSVEVTEAPAVEPVTLAELRTDLGMHHTDHDTLLGNLITAAREWCENYTRRAFVWQTLVMRMDCFPAVILLPKPPFRQMVAIRYEDGSSPSAEVDAANYEVDGVSAPARVTPVFGGVWPTPNLQLNAVHVEWIAGYPPSDDSPTDYAANVPQGIKQAIRLLARQMYEDSSKAPEENRTVQLLLAPHVVRDYRLE